MFKAINRAAKFRAMGIMLGPLCVASSAHHPIHIIAANDGLAGHSQHQNVMFPSVFAAKGKAKL